MMKISDPWIAKEKFKNLSKIEKKLSHDLFVEFIEKYKDYFIWQEDTEEGKKTLIGLSEIPESFREKITNIHNKRWANAEFNSKKGYYEVILKFNQRLGVISTTFQKKIRKHHLELLLEMANYLDAHLLNNGTEIIDESYLDDLV